MARAGRVYGALGTDAEGVRTDPIQSFAPAARMDWGPQDASFKDRIGDRLSRRLRGH